MRSRRTSRWRVHLSSPSPCWPMRPGRLPVYDIYLQVTVYFEGSDTAVANDGGYSRQRTLVRATEYLMNTRPTH